MNGLGQRIARLRRQKGMTQEMLAEALGVSPQAVSKWETDNSCPDIALLLELAELLDVTVDELLSGRMAPEVQLVPQEERKNAEEMMLRIIVETPKGDNVRVNLPMAIVRFGFELTKVIPQAKENEVLQKLDLDQIMAMVESGLIGKLVEVDAADGSKVQVVVE